MRRVLNDHPLSRPAELAGTTIRTEAITLFAAVGIAARELGLNAA